MSTFTDRLGGIRSELAYKAPCRVASTGPLTLSGFQTIDGETLADGDPNLRVLVKDQTDQTQNGIYDAQSGNWSRSKDFDANGKFIRGTRVNVVLGTVGAGAYAISTADPITIGTSNIVFTGVATTDINLNDVDFTQTGSSTIRPLQNKLAETISALDFGADNTGVSDSTSAINAAIATGKLVHLTKGTYKVSTLALTANGQGLIGDGIGQTILTSASTTAPMITVADGLNYNEIAGLTLTRSVTATSSAFGIKTLGTSDQQHYHDLWIEKQYIGLVLGPTAYSEVEDTIVISSVSHGFILTNTASMGTLQWTLNHCLSEENGGSGFAVAAVTGPGSITLGEWNNCTTFANTNYGMAFLGLSDTPINDVRIHFGFIGQDGLSEIYLDTYATSAHYISDCFTELAGTGTTGPGLATPASHLGSGVEVTANNAIVIINGVVSNGHSQSGCVMSASAIGQIIGCRFSNNGNYGVAFADGSKMMMSSSSFTGNFTANTNFANNGSQAKVSGCFPESVNTYPVYTSSGKVGIGGSPSNALDVVLGSSGAVQTVRNFNNFSSSGTVAQFIAATGSSSAYTQMIQNDGGTLSSQFLSGPGNTGGMFVGTVGAYPVAVITNAQTRMTVDGSGNVVVGSGSVAPSATNGFLFIPLSTSAPSGTPASYGGRVPLVFDSADNKLYLYNGTKWIGTAMST
jgi:hypothetical protein